MRFRYWAHVIVFVGIGLLIGFHPGGSVLDTAALAQTSTSTADYCHYCTDGNYPGDDMENTCPDQRPSGVGCTYCRQAVGTFRCCVDRQWKECSRSVYGCSDGGCYYGKGFNCQYRNGGSCTPGTS